LTQPNAAGQSTGTSSSSPSPSQTPNKSGLKGGAIAGIVIAILAMLGLAVVAFYLLHRRRNRQEEKDTDPRVGELDGREGNIPPEDLEKVKPELPRHNPISPTIPSSRTELEANRASHVTELGMGAGTYSPAELEGYQVLYKQYKHSTRNIQSQEPTELYTGTPRPHNAVISATGQESDQDFERLAQEEQRLDAEIAETQRLRELRNQRASVQERLARDRQGL
jgi:hypothetical protein